jgi:PAS domain S-box-containing protein
VLRKGGDLNFPVSRLLERSCLPATERNLLIDWWTMGARKQKTILLIEDEAILAKVEAKTIRQFGYRVIVADSGRKAVRLAAENRDISLILVDVDPGKGIDGTEAARQILSKRTVPVVFLTSHPEQEMVEKVRGITRYGYVIKDSGDFVLKSSIDMAFELFEAHEKTRVSEIKYRRLHETMTDAFALVDMSGHIIEVNQSFVNMLGYSEEELLRLAYHDFTPVKWHRFESRIIKEQVMVRGFSEVYEKEYTRKDGIVFPVELRAFLIKDDKGAPSGLWAIVRDITDRKKAETALKESEEIMRYIVKNDPNAIAVYDCDLRYIAVSNRFLSDYGVKEGDVLGKRHYDVFPEMPQRWKDVHQRCLAGAIERNDDDYFERPDGSITYNRWECRPWRRADGEIGGIIMYTEVTTERKKAEMALRKARDELELRVDERTEELRKAYESLKKETRERALAEEQLRQSLKMEAIGTLAGGIAHDFNNILAAIIGFTEMTLDEISDHPLAEKNLDNVLKSATRARDLVKQILSFSRKTDYARSPLAVSPLIEETIQLLRASIPATIEMNLINTARSDVVLAAPLEVQQILMNLATNASLAMQEEGGTMEISLTDVSIRPGSPIAVPDIVPGEYLQLAVNDTGIGMSAETMERAFEPFFTTREVGKGTGMGLAVVYGMVKDLQGAITLESEFGVGSTFRVFLPKVTAEPEQKQLHSTEIPPGKERILFVDDEDMLVKWGQGVLERLGYTVAAVVDSAEALRIFSSDPFRFDLVITDQAMSGMSGIQLSKELLKIKPDTPIILCTGHSETASPVTARKAGIREFLMKPLARLELAQAVRRVLDGKPGSGTGHVLDI